MQDVKDIVGDYTGLSRKVLDYSLEMARMMEVAKQPGFSIESWAPLSAFVAVDDFERVGNFKEVMRWDEYIGFLSNWAPNAEWECSFRRITEKGNVVLLELEERSRAGGHASVVNSVSVYEFDKAGKIRHLDIYLQMPLPDSAMLQSYEGIKISE